MTSAERNLVIECLRDRLGRIDGNPDRSSEQAMVSDLIERFKAAKVSDEKPAAKPKATVATSTKSTRNFAIIEARETINRIVEMCEEVGNYDSTDAQDFASSVQEKAESIGTWIDEHGDVTEKQQEALDNMESGISRWIR